MAGLGRSSRLKLAVADHDLNRPLIDGLFAHDGLDLDVVWDLSDGDRHARMLREAAFDACEFSLANYLVLKDRGVQFDAIPVFPNRKFRHGYIFINRNAGIREPADLGGRRVGLRGWSTTASLWARGILQRTYGVDLRGVAWFSPPEAVDPTVPEGVSLERLREEQSLDAMLVAGELDAVIYPDILPSVRRGAPEVGRLFEDYKRAEQEYYRATRIFPISHLVVLRPGVVDRFPGVGVRLLRAFRQSRDVCFARMEEQHVIGVSWTGALLAEQRELMGTQYWPYNVTDNRHVLETLVSFAAEQAVISRPVPVDDLFLPETLDEGGA